MAIKVTYYYSACVLIETPDAKILCDPWFTDPTYDGSWYHYPEFPNALERIPAADYIYVSHIHPDHYDPIFLKAYLAKHPGAKVIIADFTENVLSMEMAHHGIPHEIVCELSCGETRIGIFPNEAVPGDIDSALAVRRGKESIANMNDNLPHQPQLAAIKSFCGEVSIALLGYMGAGPYPQTYFTDPTTLKAKAEDKKRRMFERYRELAAALDPKVALPFAGQYVLGGALAGLNEYRGVPDATEVLAFDPKAVVLDTGGSIDTETLKPQGARTAPYDAAQMRRYIESLRDKPMDYERFFPVPFDYRFDALLPKAYARARAASSARSDHYFCIQLPQGWFYANANKSKDESGFAASVEHLSPRSEIAIAPAYLFGLLTQVFHWNNAQVGSQYRTTRIPDRFDRLAEGFLDNFQV